MKIEEFVIQNKTGNAVHLCNYGATVMKWLVKDQNDNILDVILGFNEKERYLQKHPSFGCIVGRNSNRIAHGQFQINNSLYQLQINNGPNNLHSGNDSFRTKWWTLSDYEDNRITLRLESEDGESGFPGNMNIEVTYSLSDENDLTIDYQAISDQDTICNLTNHAYFNLDGESAGEFLHSHSFLLHAKHYLPTDKYSIPTGVIQSIVNTPMDFRTPRKIDRQIMVNSEIFQYTGGYDHNYVLNNKKQLQLAAEVSSDISGLTLLCHTDMPGMQFYGANSLNAIKNKSGADYGPYHGFCLETQHYPDAPNHSHFPTSILRKNELYRSKTIYTIR